MLPGACQYLLFPPLDFRQECVILYIGTEQGGR